MEGMVGLDHAFFLFFQEVKMNLNLKVKIMESGHPQIRIAQMVGLPEPLLSKIVNGE
jgi:hypothetical protein